MEPSLESLGTEELQKYWNSLAKYKSHEQEKINQLVAFKAECERVIEQLQQLPQKLEHPIMVPCGKHAFFPGHLYHTNEVFVDIGCGYRVKRTAPQAIVILQRRCAFLDKGIRAGEKTLQVVGAKQAVTGLQVSEENREIRQTEADSDALLAAAPKPVRGRSVARPKQTLSDEEIAAQIRQLALQEQEAERPPSSISHAPPTIPSSAHGADTETDSDDDTLTGHHDLAMPELAFQPLDLDDILEDDPTPPPSSSSTPLQTTSSPASTHTDSTASSSLQSQIVQSPPSSHTQPQTQTHQPASQKPVKSILKKGFFLSDRGTPKPLHPSPGPTPNPAPKPTSSPTPQPKKEEAFTGLVLERAPETAEAAPPSTDQPAFSTAVSGLPERVVEASRPAQHPNQQPTARKKLSKFKQRALGLE